MKLEELQVDQLSMDIGEKAKNRQLICEEDFHFLDAEINNIGVKLNNYIKLIGKTNNDY